MDPTLSAEGGFFHKECFKCSHCRGQLTLQNFAQIKGVLVRCLASRAAQPPLAPPRPHLPSR
jgi:hypothetical protein